MNRQIVQLFGLFTLLFAVLLVFTSRWTVFEASSLAVLPRCAFPQSARCEHRTLP